MILYLDYPSPLPSFLLPSLVPSKWMAGQKAEVLLEPEYSDTLKMGSRKQRQSRRRRNVLSKSKIPLT